MKRAERALLKAYERGCNMGYLRWTLWRAGARASGAPGLDENSLKEHVWELALNLRAAKTDAELNDAKGAIVGFCWNVEFPAEAAACRSAVEARGMRAGRQGPQLQKRVAA